MQSKVTKIEFKKQWHHKTLNKDFDSYWVEMENGDKGEVNAVGGGKPPWSVGEDAEYEVQAGQGDYPDKIKKAKPAFTGGGSGSKWQPPTWQTEQLKIPSTSTSYAKDLAGVCLQAGLMTLEQTPAFITKMAKVMAATQHVIAKEGGLE